MPGMYDHLPAAMTVADVCQELQLCQKTVLGLINSGELYAIKLTARCYRVPRESFMRFLSPRAEAQEAAPQGSPALPTLP